jgi:hypothetical protein
MSTRDEDEEEAFGGQESKEIPVKELPYYETLRIILEPYRPCNTETDSDVQFSSSEIITQIEQHHGVPQGIVGKEIHQWVLPEDFVRAMRYLGFKEVNSGGLQLQWIMKYKKAV